MESSMAVVVMKSFKVLIKTECEKTPIIRCFTVLHCFTVLYFYTALSQKEQENKRREKHEEQKKEQIFCLTL